MAGKTKTPAAAPITESTVIPYTQGITYGQARWVRRAYGRQIKKGALLAREGAWNNKAVVAYVVYGGEVNGQWGPRHVYIVGMCALGQLFADGRLKPGKAEQIREVEIETAECAVGRYELGGWALVECFDPVTRKAAIVGNKDGEFVHRTNDQQLLLDESFPNVEPLTKRPPVR